MQNGIEDIIKKIIPNLDTLSKIFICNHLMKYREGILDTINTIVNNDTLKAVWNVCDGKSNISNIASKLERNKGNISREIKPWLDAKIAFEIIRNNAKYPITIDALIFEINNSILLSCVEMID